MIQKKICMLGTLAVGKTSLVRRYVENLFSEKYQTTLGVKVDKKLVKVDNQDITLVLWDLAGQDSYNGIRQSYLRGASGYLLVVDKTRTSSLDFALKVYETERQVLGDIPCVLIFNKWDLTEKWDITENTVDELGHQGWDVIRTSAKTGMQVNDAFERLAKKMIAQ
ncbi:MAG: Rab family GTPase [Dehalococcoidia bacterium]|jgi:small GTP-binding protein